MASLRTLEKGLFLAALALVACTKEDDSDTGGNDTDTGDTSPVYLEPFWFSIDAYFGYDSATNQIIAYNGTTSSGAFTQNPAMVVTLIEEGASAQQAGDDICVIIAEQAGPLPAKTTFSAVDNSSHPVLLGFELDWAQATITHDCDGLLDPAVWGEDLAAIETVRWGAGITAPIDTLLAAQIKDQVEGESGDWAADWEPYLLGGRPFFSSTGTIWSPNGDPKEFYFGFGNAIDGTTHTLIMDGDSATPLLASDISDGTLPTGAYGLQTAYLLNFQEPLAGVLIATE